MNRLRLLAVAVVAACVALIASYYLFGGPLHISIFFPIDQTVETKPAQIPILPLPTNGPGLGQPSPTPTVSPTQRPHPSMRTPTLTDKILHASPIPISLSPTQAAVTPMPGPSYEPVTPPPYGQTIPPVIMPHAGLPLPNLMTPTPSPDRSPKHLVRG